MIILNENYWDCECKEHYIHPKSEKKCDICEAEESYQPDSRSDEIKYENLSVTHLILLHDVSGAALETDCFSARDVMEFEITSRLLSN